MATRKAILTVASAIALTVSGCGSSPQSPYSTSPYGSPVPVSSASSPSSSYGVVQSIDMVQGQQSSGALGTVAGAVIGGVLGNQIGGGSGRTAATIAGAAGGGMVGNQVQKNMHADAPGYRVTVRMENGAMQTVMLNNPPGVQAGDRVRLQDGVIVERLR